jgi:membrane protein
MADVIEARPPSPEVGPRSPVQLTRRSWLALLKRTLTEFNGDNAWDWAAALTYYGVLSIFPGLLVLVSVVGLASRQSVQPMLDSLSAVAPGAVRTIINEAVSGLQNSREAASLIAVVGLAFALWSASGYVGAFMRASNAMYDVPEGRPIWKTFPIRVGVTAATGVLLVITATIVVVTGDLARALGRALGLESATVTAWSIAKWPVLVVLVGVLFGLLYWASPNARQSGFRWVSPGGALAVVLWMIASALFGFYAINFASYDKTYGTLAGVIVFLVWLWISNLALLLGLEFDAELERQRAIAAGHPPQAEPYLRLRDDRAVKNAQESGLEGWSPDGHPVTSTDPSPEEPRMPAPETPKDVSHKSASDLVRQGYTQVTTLVRDEVALAKSELTEKAKQAGVGAGLFGAAAMLTVFGVACLIATAIIALSIVWPAWLAALTVAVLLLLVAGVTALVGRRRLNAATPMFPTEAVEGLSADVDAVKTAVQERSSHDH